MCNDMAPRVRLEVEPGFPGSILKRRLNSMAAGLNFRPEAGQVAWNRWRKAHRRFAAWAMRLFLAMYCGGAALLVNTACSPGKQDSP
jgi:hypothetical protein